jgi:O-antigen/teichoic acid export membrane protein
MIATTDRLMVTNLVGLHATGLYAVGAQVAMVIGVLEQSVNQAWAPWLFGKLREGTPANFRRIRRITRIYNVSILGLAGLLALVAPALLRLLVGPEFYPAAEFVAWLALASAFSGMYKMVVNQIFYANKTHWLAWITFATGVVNLPVTYLLIRANGALGAAQGTAMAYFMSYACTAVLSARVTRELQPNA